jgi:hypothetical protein
MHRAWKNAYSELSSIYNTDFMNARALTSKQQQSQ